MAALGGTDLARAFATARARAGLDQPGCTRCGGLHRRSRDTVIVLTGTTPPTCPACGLSLDHKGRAVGRRRADGTVALTVYQLPELPEHLMARI